MLPARPMHQEPGAAAAAIAAALVEGSAAGEIGGTQGNRTCRRHQFDGKGRSAGGNLNPLADAAAILFKTQRAPVVILNSNTRTAP